MRVSYKWLKEYVDITVGPQELADRLTLAGIAVENVVETGKGIHGVVTGRIEAITRHPNADKLVVTTVNTGREKHQIITAATNVGEGDVIPVALEGARLASGLVIKKARLRGVESRGMMCSGQELGIDPRTMPPDQAHGIMILPPGTPIGRDAKEILDLDDYILELDLTPNRGDCLSMIGVAREVAALLGGEFRPPAPAFPELPESVEGQARVDIEAPDLCRRYAARLIKNVHAGRSPLWMQNRLRAAGVRPISNIVDVTNYVMLEMGQPLHAFDYHTLKDGHIIVRRASEGEKIVSLDGVERTLTAEMLVIADPGGPVAVAGVMGGQDTEVTEKTTAVLLESAFFHNVSIRRTSRALGLRSEASLRFEKGIDIGGCVRAADRAAQLIREMGAGDVVAGVIDNYPAPAEPRTILLRPERAGYILGDGIPVQEAADTLTRLQFTVRRDGDRLFVTVPTHRVDVSLEVDLIEELARVHGYDRFKGTLPFGPTTHGMKTARQSFTGRVRDAVAGAGLVEVITYSFTSPRVFDLLGLPRDSTLRDAVKLQNPLSEEHSVMRTVMVPGLLEILARNNKRRVQDVAVFEIGRVFYPKGEGRQPEERPVLAAAATGKTPGTWNTPAAPVDFYYLKGILENLFEKVRTAPVSFIPGQVPGYHPGRTAVVEVEGRRLGVIGEMHPDVQERLHLPSRVVAFEIDLIELFAVSGRPLQYEPLPRFPGVDRDLAFTVKQELPSAGIFQSIRKAGGPLLRKVSLFDVYTGEQVLGGVAEGFEEGGDRELPPPVDADVDDVLGIDLHVDPGAAHRNDPRAVDDLAARVGLSLVVVEEDAGRTLELADDDPFDAVKNKRPLVRNQRNVTKVDLLLFDVFEPFRFGRA
ncbi:MAG: phenylalanine--tRNA ligase subunit beta, partial [Firmicutes bacterium]|nr:phenylalanine--tRNA ligase subunit beta [Bacillota bacterium]